MISMISLIGVQERISCGFVHLLKDIALDGLRFVLAVFPLFHVDGS